MEVRTVLERKDGIKMAIIPKKSKYQKGDKVLIVKLNTKNLEFVNKLMEDKKDE